MFSFKFMQFSSKRFYILLMVSRCRISTDRRIQVVQTDSFIYHSVLFAWLFYCYRWYEKAIDAFHFRWIVKINWNRLVTDGIIYHWPSVFAFNWISLTLFFLIIHSLFSFLSQINVCDDYSLPIDFVKKRPSSLEHCRDVRFADDFASPSVILNEQVSNWIEHNVIFFGS